MAQLIVAAAGAAIGGATLGTGVVALGMTGPAIGWAVGSMIGAQFGSTQKSAGPRLNDLTVQGTDYGQTIPWVAGSPRIAGQIVWASPKRETSTTTEVGKGGGGSEYTSYSYDVDLLILLTENPISGVSRIWKNKELVFADEVTNSSWDRLTIYTGTEDQLPDPTYEAAVGTANAPAYRGMGSVFIEGLKLGSSGAIPNLEFEVGTSQPVTVQTWPMGFAGPYDVVKQQNETIPPTTFATYYNQPGIIWGGVRAFNITYPSEWIAAGGPTGMPHGSTLFTPGQQVEISHSLKVVPGRLTRVFFILDDVIRDSSSAPDRAEINGMTVGGGTVNNWTFSGNFCRYYEFTPDSDTLSVFFRVNDNSTTAQSAGFGVSQFYQKIDIDTNPELLSDVISDLMLNSGISPDAWVNSVSANTVRGLSISQLSPTRNIIEQLQTVYDFDIIKSDKIYFRPRSTTPVVTIPYEDLGLTQGPYSGAEPFKMELVNELEVPAQVSIQYYNVLADYQVGTELSDRLISSQTSTSNVQLPLGLTPAEAKRIADLSLRESMSSQMKTTITLPLKYSYIEPADIIMVSNETNTRTYRMRVVSKKDHANSLEFDCISDDQYSKVSNVTTSTGYTSQSEVIIVADTDLRPLDIPMLRDTDDSPGYYVAAKADSNDPLTAWGGCAVVQSWDNLTFTKAVDISSASKIGVTESVLPNFVGGNVVDWISSVNVNTGLNQLSSSTKDLVISDRTVNVAVIGNEVIQFINAAMLSEGRYQLTGLIRGRLGTEWAMTTHALNERFVLLDAAKLRKVENITSQIGLTQYLKGVTLTQNSNSITAESFINTGVNLKPLSPVNLRVDYTELGITTTWLRRTRYGYRYVGTSGVSVPLGESSESYTVKVYSGSTLKRTSVVNSNSFVYTTTMQTEDGFVNSNPVTITICQMSSKVGEGYSSSITASANN